jgi:hypothetical protein
VSISDGALDLARAGADGARHPVQRSQLVDDRALDAGDRIGLELDLTAGVEALDGADQPEQAVRDEVLLVDVRGKRRAQTARHEFDERRVGQDQPVPQRAIARLPVLLPQGQGIPRHG